jgi:very-short-patch-repair endonuclease
MKSLSAYIWLIAALLVGVAVVSMLLAKRKRLDVVDGSVAPYFGKVPLTGAEQEFFSRLQAAMPECVVLAQVALSSLVGVKEREDWKRWFNRISQKSVDFVLCLPHDFTVVAVIELDDLSHTRPDRQRADTVKDVALRVAGHPVLRFKRHEMPSVEQIRALIAGDRPVTASL